MLSVLVKLTVVHHDFLVKRCFETLRNMIEEFVSRDGSDWGDAGGSMEAKIEQVLRQLRAGKIFVAFDLTSQTANIVTKA